MSKGTRLRAERMRQRNPLLTPPARPRPGEQIDSAFLPGACLDTPEQIADMQKRTHDGLIAMVGDRRRSGIRWHHVHGATQGRAFLADAYPDLADEGVDEYRAFLDRYDARAVLVIAECDAVAP